MSSLLYYLHYLLCGFTLQTSLIIYIRDAVPPDVQLHLRSATPPARSSGGTSETSSPSADRRQATAETKSTALLRLILKPPPLLLSDGDAALGIKNHKQECFK